MYNLRVHVEQKDVLNHRLVGFVAAILVFSLLQTPQYDRNTNLTARNVSPPEHPS